MRYNSLKEMFSSDLVLKDLSNGFLGNIDVRYKEYLKGENHYTSDIEKMDTEYYPTSISYIFQDILGNTVANVLALLNDEKIVRQLNLVVNDYCEAEDDSPVYTVETLERDWDAWCEAIEMYIWDLAAEDMKLGDFRLEPVSLSVKSNIVSAHMFYKEETLILTLEETEKDIIFKMTQDGSDIVNVTYKKELAKKELEDGEKNGKKL